MDDGEYKKMIKNSYNPNIRQLNLTKGQQDVLANFCELAGSVLRKHENDNELLLTDIGDEFCDIILKANTMGFNSQSFGRMYDLLHRSGANA